MPAPRVVKATENTRKQMAGIAPVARRPNNALSGCHAFGRSVGTNTERCRYAQTAIQVAL